MEYMLDKIEVLLAAVEQLDCEVGDTSFREDYSGRGMYGASTPAIVSGADLTEVNKAIRRAAADLFDCLPEEDTAGMSTSDIMEECAKYELRRSDNMGRDYIYY